MFEYTEYELQKRRHKQELVRNEFKTVGNYQIPLIRKQEIDLDTISLISFSDTKQDDKENAYKTVHFFTYDWLFEKVYDKVLRVIPTISWGDESSFDFCFDGVEEGATVAVCTYYRENCEEEFMLGYNRMLEVIKPQSVICYDEPFPSMKGNIKSFLPTTYEWTKSLGWQDQAKFYMEKHTRNIIQK